MYSTIAANTNLYAIAKGVEIEMIDVFSHFIFVHVTCAAFYHLNILIALGSMVSEPWEP